MNIFGNKNGNGNGNGNGNSKSKDKDIQSALDKHSEAVIALLKAVGYTTVEDDREENISLIHNKKKIKFARLEKRQVATGAK